MVIPQLNSKIFSVSFKLQMVVFAVVLLLVGGQALLNLHNVRQQYETIVKQDLTNLHDQLTDEVLISENTAEALAITLAQRPDVQDRLQARDHQDLLELLEPVFTILNTEFGAIGLKLYEPGGHILVQIHDNDVVDQQADAVAISSRQSITGVELDSNRMAIQGRSSISHQGQVIGQVEVSLEYGQTLLEDFKERHRADITIWLLTDDTLPAGLDPADNAPPPPLSELFYHAGTRAVPLSLSPELYDIALHSRASQLQLGTNGNQELAVLVAPLVRYGERIIGLLEISISQEEALAALRASQRTIWATSAGLTLLALVLIWSITRLVVSRPLDYLTAVAQRQLTGDIAARSELLSIDEFGMLGRTINVLATRLEGLFKDQDTFMALRTAELEQELRERERVEASLRESETLYLSLFNQSHDAVFILDLEGHCLRANRRAAEMFGYSESEIQKLSFHDFTAEPVQSEQVRADLLSGKRVPLYERILKKKNGEQVQVEININLVRDTDGSPLHVQSLIRDITQRKQAEAALKASEGRYRAIVEDQNEFLVRWRPDGTRTFVNEAYCRYFGQPREALLESSFFPLISDEYRERVQNRLAALTVENPVSSDQHQVIRPDGSKGWQHWTDRAIFDEAGQVIEYQSVGRDITDQVQAEQEMRRIQQQLQDMFDYTPAAVYARDMSGRFIFVNRLWRERSGYAEHDIIGKTGKELFPEIYAKEWNSFEKQVLESGQATQFEEIGQTTGKVYLAMKFLLRESNGQAYALAGISLDISERKRAEEEIRRRNRELTLLNQIIAASATGMEVDSVLDMVCYELAQAFEVPMATASLFNTSKTELTVRAEYQGEGQISILHDVIRVEDMPVAVEILYKKTPLVIQDAAADDRLGARLEHARRRKVSSSICVPLIIEEDVVGLLVFASVKQYDFSVAEIELIQNVANQVAGVMARIWLTERHQQLEAQFHQAQKMEAVGLLAGGIAHDFNNLLTSINGFAELVQQQLAADDPLKEMVGTILGSGRRAATLTRQLLAFSRKQAIMPETLNLNTVVTEMNRMLRRTIGEHIEMETLLAADLWPVKIDPTQIEQVILNLAVNARDAMPNGGRLIIETGNTVLDEGVIDNHIDTQPGDYVVLTVSDNGNGMSAAIQVHIFEPFFTTKETGKGTGLGLATVFGIVKQNRGTIWLYSEEDVGTTFKIYLPRESEAAIYRTQVEEDMPFGSETILLAEDNAGVRKLTERVLRQQGYTLLVGQHGQEALQLANQYNGSIDLLLTDVVMPGLNGKELAGQLLQQRPDTAVLFMSGYADSMVARDILESTDSFLQKPFGPATLAHQVRAILDNRTSGKKTIVDQPGDWKRAVTPVTMAALPAAWCNSLHNAAQRGRDDLIIELLLELGPEHAQLAQVLSQLTHDFRFDEIVTLVKQTEGRQEEHD